MGVLKHLHGACLNTMASTMSITLIVHGYHCLRASLLARQLYLHRLCKLQAWIAHASVDAKFTTHSCVICGWQVTVVESHSVPGGAAHTWERNGYHFESGPSLYSGMGGVGKEANPLGHVLQVWSWSGWS